jgi:hypothetical protein
VGCSAKRAFLSCRTHRAEWLGGGADLNHERHELDEGSGDGVAAVTFDREAESLESAIRSAVADVQKAGCMVKHTIVEHPEPVM